MNSIVSTTNHISPVFNDKPKGLTKSAENLNLIDVNKSKFRNGQMRRSKTLKDISEFRMSHRSTISGEKLRLAKEKVDEAIKKGKIFAVFGPYHRIRQILRERGWVEKFYNGPINTDYLAINRKSKSTLNKSLSSTVNAYIEKQNGVNSDDDDDDDDDGFYDDDLMGDGEVPVLPPWEEEDGLYGIMSRMLRNHQPNLFWTLRKNQVDYQALRKDQIINHHARSGTFTTKTGLAKSLQSLRWYDKSSDGFFPRCYIISSPDDKNCFIENFRLTACIGLIKEVVESTVSDASEKHNSDSDKQNTSKSKISNANESNMNYVESEMTNYPTSSTNPTKSSPKKILPKIHQTNRQLNANKFIDFKYLEMAIAYCEFYLKEVNHDDIDMKEFLFCWKLNWDEFLSNYYKVVHEGYRISQSDNPSVREQCTNLHSQFNKIHPQFNMDGNRNVWILKPGAKSRGRGITCYSTLNDMLKLVSSSMVLYETRFIVQKYIERPLLVYNTKFDIRQWFLVTDWNPLTIWWYKDSYLRFCSQQFTLDDFDESVHLSNNSIQYKYLNGPRSSNLPEENMWSWDQFDEYLKENGYGNAWDNTILPGMKEAVICSLLCVQDEVDWRKNTFEMYGADFMVSEGDLQPWLIEINASPCVAASTSVTARLTEECLNDLFKVVLDRRENKNANTGQFELLYKQLTIPVPSYIGIDLKLTGTTIKNPYHHHQASYLHHNATDRRFSQRNIINDNRTRRSVVEEIYGGRKKLGSEVVPTNESIQRLSRPKVLLAHKDEMKKRSQTVNGVVPFKLSKPYHNVQSRYWKSMKLTNDSSPQESSDELKTNLENKAAESEPPESEPRKTEVTETGESLDLKVEPEQIMDQNTSFTNNSYSISPPPTASSHSSTSSASSKVQNSVNKTRGNDKPFPASNTSDQHPTSVVSSRQYKVPTKVELINFSVSQHKSTTHSKHHSSSNKRMHSRSLTKPILSQLNSLSSSSTNPATNIHRKTIKNKVLRHSDIMNNKFPHNLSQQVLVQNFPIQTGSILYTDLLTHQSMGTHRNKKRNSIRQFTLQSKTINNPNKPIKIPLQILNRSRTTFDELNHFPLVKTSQYCLPVSTNRNDSIINLLKVVNNNNSNNNNNNNNKKIRKILF